MILVRYQSSDVKNPDGRPIISLALSFPSRPFVFPRSVLLWIRAVWSPSSFLHRRVSEPLTSADPALASQSNPRVVETGTIRHGASRPVRVLVVPWPRQSDAGFPPLPPGVVLGNCDPWR